MAEKYFGVRFWWFGNISEFIGRRLGLENLHGDHKPGDAPLGRSLEACRLLVGFGIFENIGGRNRSVESRGAHKGGGAPYPLGAPSVLGPSSWLL